jgi:hypothetical protein
MHMLLERAASYFQGQGYFVKVNPCISGDSGAIHNPGLHLSREGEKAKVVFVFDELDGIQPLEGRAHMARDMGCEPVFVIGRPSPDVRAWMERHRRALLADEDLPGAAPRLPPPLPAAPAAPPAPTLPAIPEEDGGAMLLPSAPARLPERPLTAFSPAPAPTPAPAPVEARPQRPRMGRGRVEFPTEVPEDGDAEILVTTPSKPKPASQGRGRGVVPTLPTVAPEDGDAMILPSRPLAPPPAPEPVEHGDTGAEVLPSQPMHARDPDKVLKHDPSIWDPRARLQAVKQAAKAQSFETTGVAQGAASPWLNGLRKKA